jgi:hypothetical protein
MDGYVKEVEAKKGKREEKKEWNGKERVYALSVS